MQLTPDIEKLIDLAIMEDYSMGDATTDALISNETIGSATVVADEGGTIAGLGLAVRIFQKMDPSLETTILIPDGSKVTKNDRILEINGYLSSILTAERTALNFLRKLSGVATETSKYVDEISHTNSRIVDTRKTTPGLRTLEKYAVRVGGGSNHRFGLHDAVLIKDNHREIAGGVVPAIVAARASLGHLTKLEVEVDTLEQLAEALDAGADVVLLDNMCISDLKQAVAMARGRATTEASGGITPETIRAVASTGVDIISVGWVTHSTTALDVGLDVTF